MVPRPKTSPSTSEKAATTIKVFNLNAAPKLVGARREALRSSVNTAKEIYEWREGGEIDEDTFDELIQEELESLEGREFETALRDIFEYNSFYGE